jgi:hypothetical protein
MTEFDDSNNVKAKSRAMANLESFSESHLFSLLSPSVRSPLLQLAYAWFIDVNGGAVC